MLSFQTPNPTGARRDSRPPHARGSLLTLPAELLFMIADCCTLSDTKNLMLCNQHLYDILYDGHFLSRAVQNDDGTTVLQAAYDGNLTLLKTLHRGGARMTTRWGHQDFNLYSYLKMDVSPSVISREMIRLCKPDPDAKFLRNFHALHLAIVGTDVKDGLDRDGVVSWLLEHGADIDSRCRGMCRCAVEEFTFFKITWTALHLALCTRRESLARLLIRRGAAINNISSCGTQQGWTALHTAVDSGPLDMVKLILEHKDCNIDAAEPITALYKAVEPWWSRRNGLDTTPHLRLLLQAGAAINIECPADNVRDNPTGHRWQAPRYSGRLLPLHYAALLGNYEATVLLLNAGTDVNTISGGRSPLHCALTKGYICSSEDEILSRRKVIETLLACGADINRTYGLLDMTPLMQATQHLTFPVDVIQLLLDYGADVKAADSRSQNALHYLIAPLYVPFSRILGYPGGFIGAPFCLSSAMDGTDQKFSPIINCLVQAGCSIDQKNVLGDSFIDLAIWRDRELFYKRAKSRSEGSSEEVVSWFVRAMREMSLGSGADVPTNGV